MTVTLTNQSKNAVSITSQMKGSANMMTTGTPIGLLLSLTYTFAQLILTNQTRNAVVLTNQAKS